VETSFRSARTEREIIRLVMRPLIRGQPIRCG
jgi:hypothetical protein